MKIELEIEPLPQPRPRFTRGRCFEPARISEYKQKIAEAARVAMQGLKPLTAQLDCRLKFFRTTRRRCDLDNLAKAVLDALSGICFLDDSQIFKLTCEKNLSAVGKVEIELAKL